MFAHSKEGVQRSILHELSDDHDRTALGDHPLQVNDVGMVELAHDAGLAQEVPSLLFCVARLQSFDGHKHLPFARQLQVTAAHLSKLSCEEVTEQWFYMSKLQLADFVHPFVINQAILQCYIYSIHVSVRVFHYLHQ